jgi:hypothetical protein
MTYFEYAIRREAVARIDKHINSVSAEVHEKAVNAFAELMVQKGLAK